MTFEENKTGKYTIGIISEMLNVHPQTLRLYEKRGLVTPSRTRGNTRLYSDSDVERIKTIIRLTDEFGVNLNGVEIILRLHDRIEALEMENDSMKEMMWQMYETLVELEGEKAASALIRVPSSVPIFCRSSKS